VGDVPPAATLIAVMVTLDGDGPELRSPQLATSSAAATSEVTAFVFVVTFIS
jgi:hypothetical protein